MTTILIVEDDRLLNEGLKFMLEKENHKIIQAYSYQEGIRIRPSVWSFWTLISPMRVALYCVGKSGERVPFRLYF
jgi:DNA-binding NtrC family response regulator